MKIKYEQTFFDRLNRQLTFIAKDKKSASIKLRNEIKTEIEALKDMPYRCRQSIFFEQDNIRDLVVRGYVVTYRINENTIEVFGLTKYQSKPIEFG